MSKVKLKPCSLCGVMPVIEYWASGGMIFAIRCNNPDRPDSCDIPFYYSRSKSSYEAIIKWNAYQDGGEIYEKVNEAWDKLTDGKYCSQCGQKTERSETDD